MSATSRLQVQGLAPDLTMLLALCPLFAAADTLINAVGLSAAILAVALSAASIAALVERWLGEDLRFPAFVLILAFLTALAEIVLATWLYDVRRQLGIFLPLLAVNAAILLTLHTTGRQKVEETGKICGALCVSLLLLGIGREIVGRGSLGYGAQAFGQWAAPLEMPLFRTDMGFLLAMLPPGAFISLGVLLALFNWITRRHVERR